MHLSGKLPRSRVAFGAVVVALALLVSACLTPSQNQVLNEMNADRQAHGLRALPIHNEAQAKAQGKAAKRRAATRLATAKKRAAKARDAEKNACRTA